MAIGEFKSSKFEFIGEAARVYDIPLSTFKDRLNC